MKNFYEVLEVEKTADDATIKSAYRKLAVKYHPDKNAGSKEAEAKFQAISEAYEVLKDPQKRAAHDYELTPRASHEQFSWSSQNFDAANAASINLDEILRDIQNSQRRAQGNWQTPPKNKDIVLGYSITLEEAFHGKTAEISYNLPGNETQQIQIKIPKGIQDGVKLRFQGKGDNALPDVPPGDLYVRIATIPHMNFIRMGYHVATSVQIDYLDAMLGAEVEIPTIEGGKIKMRVPAGIFPGQNLRADGKGMPMQGETRGDMMIEVVIVPTKLSEEERVALEEIRSKRSA